jgi:hypothetical protein
MKGQDKKKTKAKKRKEGQNQKREEERKEEATIGNPQACLHLTLLPIHRGES